MITVAEAGAEATSYDKKRSHSAATTATGADAGEVAIRL